MRTVTRSALALILSLAAACGPSKGGAAASGGGGGAATSSAASSTSASGSAGGGGAGGGDAGGGGAVGSSTVTGSGGACPEESLHTGDATYYDWANGTGACSFDPSPDDLMIGAMNAADYQGSAACGACAHLVGPLGELTIRIVDLCPECLPGDIDLSIEAFAKIADPVDGRVKMAWRYVPCDVTGPVHYYFKEGSNPFWTAVQIRNHRNAIAKLEARDEMGAYQPLPRAEYNYFIGDSGLGPGPYAFRITDVLGNTVDDEGIVFVEAGDAPSATQFPACAGD